MICCLDQDQVIHILLDKRNSKWDLIKTIRYQIVQYLGSRFSPILVNFVLLDKQQDCVFVALNYKMFLTPQSVMTSRFLLSAARIACLWLFSPVSGIHLLSEKLECSMLSSAKLRMGLFDAKNRTLIWIRKNVAEPTSILNH